MIRRILLVAGRELRATLLTRAFILMVLTPVIAVIAVPFVLVPLWAMSQTTEQDRAQLQVRRLEVYPADWVAPLDAQLDDTWNVVPSTEGDPAAAAATLFESQAHARLVIGPDAVTTGTYTLLLPGPDRGHSGTAVSAITTAVDRGLVDARLVQSGLSEAQVSRAREVSATVEYVEPEPRDAAAIFASVQGFVMPAAVLFLMFSTLSMAGQGLLTSTLEEKSTRVAEVLLGAVSPVELLTGKVLGQLGVAVIMALTWSLPSLLMLAVFVSYVVGPVQVLYLLVLVAIASLSWATVMGGVGAAMNDLTEAQHILGPLFMVMMLFFLPAGAAMVSPDSGLVVACSLIPPTAAPTMAARILSNSPPPHWQVWLGILTSGGFGLALLWAAGKLFRIGLLLRSSPPNARTLLRWLVSS